MLDLAAAQDALSAALHAYTLRTPQRTPAVTSPCGFAGKGGVINAGDVAREKRWAATITLPARTTLELAADEEVTIDQHPGRIYRIVHAPGPDAVNLERAYGVMEF